METFETKFDLLDAAYKDKNIKKSTMALLQYLISKSDRMKCFPSVDTIAKAMNVCRRTVQYNMRKLEAAGYIIRKDRWYNHQQLSNCYEFNFGIKTEEELTGNYSNQDKEKINNFFEKLSTPNDNPRELSKAKEIIKVYNMNLSKYEKLLMVYFIHRANKSALIYDDLIACADAIGVCRTTMVRLLNSLRSKGLILVQKKQMGQTGLIVIKLTRNAYTNKNDESIKNRQNKSADQHQNIGNNYANMIKRNNLDAPWSLHSNFLEYIRKIFGCHFVKKWKVLFRYFKKKKKLLSDFLKTIGNFFSSD